MAGLHAGPRLVALDADHDGSFVEAQLAGPPASWSRSLRADVEGVTIADFELVDAAIGEVDRSLDLVVVARAD